MKQEIWAASVNLCGLYFDKPIKCTRDNDYGAFWDKEGNFMITKVGINSHNHVTEFSSKNKKEVQLFIDGAIAVMKILKYFSCSGVINETE